MQEVAMDEHLKKKKKDEHSKKEKKMVEEETNSGNATDAVGEVKLPSEKRPKHDKKKRDIEAEANPRITAGEKGFTEDEHLKKKKKKNDEHNKKKKKIEGEETRLANAIDAVGEVKIPWEKALKLDKKKMKEIDSENNSKIIREGEKGFAVGECNKMIENEKNTEAESELNSRNNGKEEKKKGKKKGDTVNKEQNSLPNIDGNGNVADEVCANSRFVVKGKRIREKSPKNIILTSTETNGVGEESEATKVESQKNPVCDIGEERVDNVKKEKWRREEKDGQVSNSLKSEAHAEGLNDERNTRSSGDESKKKKRRTADDESRLKDEKDIKKKKLKQSVSVENETVRDITDGKPSTRPPTNNKTKQGNRKKNQKGENTAGTPEGPSSKKLEEKTIGATSGKVKEKISTSQKEMGASDSEASNSRNKNKKEKSIVDDTTSKEKKKRRRVSFAAEVEVFSPGNDTDSEDVEEQLVQGKRFTPEEDKMIKDAIDEYVETHQLGEEGIRMILHCRDYPQVKNCWKEIGASLPHRPNAAVYHRAHSLLERSEKRKWEPEEYDMIRSFYAKNGPAWKTLADQLGKNRFHVKDAWRRTRSLNFKKGAWSQDEYQALFDLVNLDLRLKVNEEKQSKHGMLRDNIHWEAISKKLSTRYDAACCLKWYKQLTSPLVSQGVWGDTDDYRLIDALQKTDACCIEDVEWGNLLGHRSGDVCRTRWNEMIRHIGGSREKTFIEQLEVLSTRYCPEMVEYRK